MDIPKGRSPQSKPVYRPKFTKNQQAEASLSTAERIRQQLASKIPQQQARSLTVAAPQLRQQRQFLDINEEQLWKAFASNRDKTLRNALINRYTNYANKIASSYRLPPYAQLTREDLQSAANLGLLESIDAFDYKRGVKFITFAGRRIYGAVIDELRRMADFPRIIAKNRRELIPLIQELTHSLGRPATTDDVCKKHGEHLRPILEDKLFSNNVYNQVEAQSENDSGSYENVPVEQCVEDHRKLSGSNRANTIELETKILNFLKDPKERTAIYCYYYMEMTIGQIARSLGVSTSTAGAIRKKALLTLRYNITRDMLEDWISQR